MSTAHTPGPWQWSDEFTSSNKEKTWSLLGADGYGILSCDGLGNSPQEIGANGRANARLIAAAPELLAFAELFLTDYQSEDGMNSMKHYARIAHEAIAKARGEA